ncbi:conserved hypothetical protein [Histoplasma capsulatum H143]|uniref:Uncharacterized protein n=1 Tax=Ajellomyces capsulatus (strain H143) TaxID=544712 RepID=C6HID5_AJECH|nr:conserved hypothetical protein [Histoplasma capsulatum H143]
MSQNPSSPESMITSELYYGIAQEDTYNFDETGFQMGVIGTARVITGSERVDNPKLIQPGD